MLEGVTERGTAARREGPRPPDRRQDRHDERPHRRLVHRRSRRSTRSASGSGTTPRRASAPKSTGGDTALPIWMGIVSRMKEAGILKPSDDFDVPQGVVFVPFDLATGYRATPVVLEGRPRRLRERDPADRALRRPAPRRLDPSPVPPEGGLRAEAGRAERGRREGRRRAAARARHAAVPARRGFRRRAGPPG